MPSPMPGAPQIQKSDWVTTMTSSSRVGLVRRVAKDGTWADVMWRSGNETWTKRMKTSVLRIETTLRWEDFSVTDMTRALEVLRG